MASYDSDSSLEYDGDYEDTTTLLGYASREPTEDAISQLGGYPTWLDDKTPPPGDFAKCKVCNDLMTMLLQLNGDMPSRFPNHERRLYLFTCRRKPCRRKEGSIRAFRGTRIFKTAASNPKPAPQEPAKEEKRADLGSAIFGGQSNSSAMPANPFASNSSSGPPPNPFSSAATLASKPAQKPASDASTGSLAETFAAKARLASPPASSEKESPSEPWPARPSFPRPYTCYALDAEYESIAVEEEAVPPQAQVSMDVDGGAGDSKGAGDGGREDKELFESGMDKTFQRFADRLSHNPEQVLRYEFDGSPLLYSSTDAVGRRLSPHAQAHAGPANAKITTIGEGGRGIPPCKNCGAGRRFELQLTPHAITMLEEDEPASAALEGMDWGTIIVGVCSADCGIGEVGYVEEWVGVQWEELQPAGGSSAKK